MGYCLFSPALVPVFFFFFFNWHSMTNWKHDGFFLCRDLPVSLGMGISAISVSRFMFRTTVLLIWLRETKEIIRSA